MIDPRAAALQGLGFGSRSTALQGLVPATAPVQQEPGLRLAAGRRTRKKRRDDDDALVLALLR